jgi:hypothetical protein
MRGRTLLAPPSRHHRRRTSSAAACAPPACWRRPRSPGSRPALATAASASWLRTRLVVGLQPGPSAPPRLRRHRSAVPRDDVVRLAPRPVTLVLCPSSPRCDVILLDARPVTSPDRVLCPRSPPPTGRRPARSRCSPPPTNLSFPHSTPTLPATALATFPQPYQCPV